MEFINKSDLVFKDVSAEQQRSYVFQSNVEVTIQNPLKLHVSDSGGHRLFDAQGVSHYVPAGWIHLRWKSKPGTPHFDF